MLVQPGVAARQSGGAIDRPVDFRFGNSDEDIAERCR